MYPEPPERFLRRLFVGFLVAVASPFFLVVSARAGCNLIPQAQLTFRGALGSVDRPFAAPGDFVELSVRPAVCDVGASEFSSDPADHVVTLVFKPAANGTSRAVVLTTAPCANLASELDACGDKVKGGVTCLQVNLPGDPVSLDSVARVDGQHLRFRLPNTDAAFAPDGDARTLSGPVTIAVTNTGDPLPCDLATTPCAGKQGVLACIDDLYAGDGSCQPNPGAVFATRNRSSACVMRLAMTCVALIG